MKAVCLLLCLGLARHITGSIFPRQNLPSLESFGQPLQDYIDPYQYQQQQYQQQQYQQQQRQPQQYKQQQHQPQLYQQQQYEQEAQYQQHLHNPVPRHFVKHVSVEMEEIPNVDVMSDESRTEQRTLKQLNPSINSELYAPPRFADPNMIPYSMSKMPSKEAYGDAIQWRGIEMAVGPHSQVTKKEQIEKIFREAQRSTKHISEETQMKFHEAYEKIPNEQVEDVELNATQLLKKYQYPVEEHTVKTDDGYFLTMFRIQKQTSSPATPKPVVLLMHGLLGSADDWLLLGPGQSLAYLLADEGYDVWLGNARGNKYSRRHASKHPAQADFWLYSNDDIALHDLPAMIDYALKTSSQPKLYYVGYSQGTTNYFALASARPEYNDKVAMMYALSPLAYMTNVRSPLIRMIAPNSPLYNNLYSSIGDGQFLPNKELVKTMGGQMCETEIGCKNICSNVNFVMSGLNLENMDVADIQTIMRHLPAGGSARQMKQYGQAVASQEFRKYDYGADINEMMYGSRTPPRYDVSKIQTPVALYYSEADWLAHPEDVATLKQQLHNVTDYYEVPVDHFSHMDYLFSKKALDAVYKRLINSINNFVTKH